jgi:chromosome segregation ATPase
MEKASEEPGRVAELEAAMAAVGRREAELRQALIEAHDQLLRRDEEVEDLQAEVGARDGQIAALRAELGRRSEEGAQLQVRLDGILASPPMRIYSKLAKLPGVRGVRRRRRARYETALAQRTDQSG